MTFFYQQFEIIKSSFNRHSQAQMALAGVINRILWLKKAKWWIIIMVSITISTIKRMVCFWVSWNVVFPINMSFLFSSPFSFSFSFFSLSVMYYIFLFNLPLKFYGWLRRHDFSMSFETHNSLREELLRWLIERCTWPPLLLVYSWTIKPPEDLDLCLSIIYLSSSQPPRTSIH